MVSWATAVCVWSSSQTPLGAFAFGKNIARRRPFTSSENEADGFILQVHRNVASILDGKRYLLSLDASPVALTKHHFLTSSACERTVSSCSLPPPISTFSYNRPTSLHTVETLRLNPFTKNSNLNRTPEYVSAGSILFI